MKRCRSWIFVPASRPAWVEKAASLGADGVVLDLEDSVPAHAKQEARDAVRSNIPHLKASGQRVIMVRTNAPGSPAIGDDIRHSVVQGLDGLMVPMVSSAEELRNLEPALAAAERAAGLEVGSIELLPTPETALGIHRAFEIAAATPRVTAMFGGGGRNGDTQRSVGFQWTAEGHERLYLLSKIVLESRAAGVRQLVGGTWVDVDDTDGAAADARRLRTLGYTGYIVIHPSHLPALNQIFTPTADEISAAREVIAQMASAAAEGVTAIRLGAAMVDTAMVETAHATLDLATELGVVPTDSLG